MCPKRVAGVWKSGGSYAKKGAGGRPTNGRLPAAAYNLIDYMLPFFLQLFYLILYFFSRKFEMSMAFWKYGCTALPFFETCPILGRVQSSIPHGAWRFHFFQNCFC
jgi:hypothetical protein